MEDVAVNTTAHKTKGVNIIVAGIFETRIAVVLQMVRVPVIIVNANVERVKIVSTAVVKAVIGIILVGEITGGIVMVRSLGILIVVVVVRS